MGRGRKWVLICLAISFAFVAFVTFSNRNNPVYQGRRLSAWLDDLRPQVPHGKSHKAEQAVQSLGTDAVPYLIVTLGGHDSKLRTKIVLWLRSRNLAPADLQLAEERRNLALRGFQAIGTLPPSTMSKLAKLLDRPEAAQAALQVLDQFGSEVEPIMIQALSNSVSAVRGDAAMFLTYRKSAAPEVVPGLIRVLKDSDAEVRGRAAMMLSQFQSKAEIVVPALIAALDDPEPLVQGQAAQSLGVFGDRAKGAVPKLIELARGKPSTAAANALARIDPEKAKELGLRGWLLPPELFPAILR